MATAYTSILKLALPVQGELSGTWGDVVNNNITSMVEEAIAGRAVINTWTTNSHTLTSADGTTSESRCAMLEFTDTGTALTGDATVVCPTAAKIYICKNDAGQKVTIKTSAGTGVAIADGQTMFVFCDGTNVVEAVTSMSSLKLGTAVTSIEVTSILDEDDLVSDSATALATQQSIKAYVDAQVTAQDLDFGGDSGTGSVDLDSQTFTIAGTSNEIETSASGQTLTVGLPAAVTVTTSVTTPTVQTTNLNANDGTAAVTIADSTGQTTITDAVLTTADINGGTADNVVIGGTTAAAGSFTTVGATGNITSLGQVITDTINEQTATSGVTVDGVLLKDGEVTTDTINEETADAGVTVDGVLLKDGGATLTGDLTVDTDTLYVDSTNDRVGINTSSPAAPLEVDGGSDIAFFDGTDVRLKIQNPATGDLQLNSSGASDSLTFATVDTEAMRITSDQRVLIGTTNSKTVGSSAAAGLQVAATGANSWISQIRYNNASSGPLLVIGKTRSATVGTVGTIVQDGDTLATLAFAGDDGVDVQTQAARIQANVDGTPGANDMPGRLSFWTTADGASSVTERMRIDNAGLVGIGTTTLNRMLNIQGDQGIRLFNDAADSYLDIDHGTDGALIKQAVTTKDILLRAGTASGQLVYETSGSEAMRIDTSQRVLIGDDSSVVVGSTAASGLQLQSTGTNSWISQVRYQNGSSGPVHNFGKTRSTTVGTVGTIVSDDDYLGAINFAADDGTDLQTVGASITARVDGTPGANDMPTRLTFLTTSDGSSSPTERMIINNAGNVIIGASDPGFQGKVDITGTTTFRAPSSGSFTPFNVRDYDSDDLFSVTVDGTTGQAQIRAHSDTSPFMTFMTGVTEAMRIDSSQRVLVGQTNARNSFFNNNVGTYNPRFQIEANDTSSGARMTSFVLNDDSNNAFIQIFGRSRGTTANSLTVVGEDDNLGILSWQGATGNALAEAAQIKAEVDGTPGSNDMPGRLVFRTTSDGVASSTERMRIDSQGFVTIGNSGDAITSLRIDRDVSDTIDLDKTYNVAPKGAWIELKNAGGTTGGGVGISAVGLGTESRYAAIAMTDQASDNSGTGGDLEFWTADGKLGALAERMTIKGSGEVLMGSPYLTNSITPMNLKLSTNGSSGNNLVIGKHVNGQFAPAIAFASSDGTEVSPTLAASGDYLGQLNFYGYDGNSYALGAYMRTVVDGAAGDGDMPTRFEFSVSPDGTESPTEAMRIDNAGRVIVNNGDVSTGTGTNKGLLQVANIDTTYDWTQINTDANGYASTANEIAVLNTANQDLNGWAGIFFQAGESSNGTSINAARIGAIKTSTGGTNTDLAFAVRNGSAAMTEMLRIDSFGGLTIKSLNGTTAAAFGGTNLVNGITAVPSSAGTPFVLGRDTGTTRSAHFAGNLKFDNGYGIDFDASHGSGRTSSVLDDYEEGTWTPTLYGHTTTGTTSGTLAGKYTKVGNMVFATVQFTAVSLSSAAGRLYMGGLPYTSVSGAPGGGLVTYLEGFNPAYTYTPDSDSNTLSVVVVGSGDYLVFRPNVTPSWDNFVNAATSTWNGGGGSTYGSLQFTYLT